MYALFQVVRLHEAAEKFMTLIPLIISKEEKIAEVSWKRETIDVPAASKLRILIGIGFTWTALPFF